MFSLTKNSSLSYVLLVAAQCAVALAKDPKDKAALAVQGDLATALEAKLEALLGSARTRQRKADPSAPARAGRPPVGFIVDQEPGKAQLVWGAKAASCLIEEFLRAAGERRNAPSSQAILNRISQHGAWHVKYDTIDGTVVVEVRRATAEQEEAMRKSEQDDLARKMQ